MRHFVGHVHHRGEQLPEIDRGRFLPLELGVEAARVGDVGDQPVEPLHVVIDHRQQAPTALVGPRQRQRFHRGTQRRKRVLQLMGNVGGEALDRLDAAVERIGHVAQRARQMPDLVAPPGEVGNLHARPDAPSNDLGAFGEASHRPGNGAGEQERQHHHDAGGDQEYLEDREPLGGDHVVDVGPLRREHQRAAHGAEALHRHRHRDDHLGTIVDPHHAPFEADERLRDLLVALAVAGAELAIGRQVALGEPAAQHHPAPLQVARPLLRRRQVEAKHVVERAAVEEERAIAVVDARPRVGRRDQEPQHRRDPLRVDREVEPGQRLLRVVALAGLQVEQPLGVDGDAAVEVDRGRGGDGGGDGLALYQEALNARLDQPGAELGEIENADDERDEAGDVEEDDAPRQA